jgi:hypothetical protein
MLDYVTDEKDSATFAQRSYSTRVGVRKGSKTMIEPLEPSDCGGAVSVHQSVERRIEL